MRPLLFTLALIASAPLTAQTIVVSPKAAAVSVTVYRGEEGEALDLEELTGFALITETREVDLPPGIVTIRFEGVASGIEPATSIIVGANIKEKNRDRRLLSQRGLLDSFTGQSVIIRRTDKATGKVTDEPGTIRSSPENLILQTQAGFESIYCSGLDQMIVYPHVPVDLTAKPTLSVTTVDQPGGKQTLTLAYLASRFDWRANYVAELSNDMRHVNLLGWITMASGDRTSFVDAHAFVVAGNIARADEENSVVADEEAEDADDEIDFQCWPLGNTSSNRRPVQSPEFILGAPAPMSMRMKASAAEMSLEDIVVTGARRAEMEELGDLKLYRIPFAVMVAAQSQKQVAFLSKPKVSGEMIYRSRISTSYANDVEMLYRMSNSKKAGLGEALPSGGVALFQAVGGRRMLVGESHVADKAVGEDVEWVLSQPTNITVTGEHDDDSGEDWEGYTVTVTNANPFPITYEAEFQSDDENKRMEKFSARLFERKGKKVWRVIVPANDERKLHFREVEIDP